MLKWPWRHQHGGAAAASVLARPARNGPVPPGWYGLRIDHVGVPRRYELSGEKLSAQKGESAWWVRSDEFELEWRPLKVSENWRMVLRATFPRPDDPASEHALAALSRRLHRHTLANKNGVDWAPSDLESALAMGGGWRLRLPPLLQPDEAPSVMAGIRHALASDYGLLMVDSGICWKHEDSGKDALQLSTSNARVDLATPKPADLRLLIDEDAVLGMRLFQELPELYAQVQYLSNLNPADTNWRLAATRLNQLARTNRFPDLVDKRDHPEPLTLLEGVKCLQEACSAMDALLDVLPARTRSAANQLIKSQLVFPAEAMGVHGRRLAAAVAARYRLANPDVVLDEPPDTWPFPAPTSTGRMRQECSVRAFLPTGDSIVLQAAARPTSEAGSFGFPGVPAGIKTVLREGIRRGRSLSIPGSELPHGVAFLFPDGMPSAGWPRAEWLLFPALVADCILRGRFGEMPAEVCCVVADIAAGSGATTFPVASENRLMEALIEHENRHGGGTYVLPDLHGLDSMTRLERLRVDASEIQIIHSVSQLYSGTSSKGQAEHRAEALFPVVLGDGDEARLVRLTLELTPHQPGGSSEISVHGQGISDRIRERIKALLAATRQADPDTLSTPGWHTTVTFSTNFSGNSWELALVLVDRIARGSLVPPCGRLFASGGVVSPQDLEDGVYASPLDVVNVEGEATKLDLLQRVASIGDRILVPADWSKSARLLVETARVNGASVGFLRSAL